MRTDARGVLCRARPTTRRRLPESELEAATRDELRQANAELRQINAALDAFSYAASHDLQEPLRTLVAFSQLLERDLGPDLTERAQADLTHIQNAARRMQGLIKDLLELSRKPDDQLRLRPIPLAPCLDDAIESLQAAISERQVIIQREPAFDLLVHGDRTLLTQIYQNLLSNAIKFVPDDRQPLIRLTASRAGKMWELAVTDNGIGVDSAFREAVFQPFKRLRSLRAVQGSGVGLALCRKAVGLLGGLVWLEAAPDGGTRAVFTVRAAH